MAWGPSQFQLQNIGSRGDKLVALVLCVLSWFTLPSGVYISQWPRQTALAIQGKLGGTFTPRISMALGIHMATGFLLAKMSLCTYTGSVWGMPHESRLNNAGGYTYLLCGGGGFSFSFLLQPINRLFGLKTNASIIVLGFNWVDSLLNGSMGEKKNRKRFCPW